MKTVRVTVRLGRTTEEDWFEVEDDATKEEIEETAQEYLHGLIDWWWEETEFIRNE